MQSSASICVVLAFPPALQRLIDSAANDRVEFKAASSEYISVRKESSYPIVVDCPMSIEEFAEKNLKVGFNC